MYCSFSAKRFNFLLWENERSTNVNLVDIKGNWSFSASTKHGYMKINDFEIWLWTGIIKLSMLSVNSTQYQHRVRFWRYAGSFPIDFSLIFSLVELLKKLPADNVLNKPLRESLRYLLRKFLRKNYSWVELTSWWSNGPTECGGL